MRILHINSAPTIGGGEKHLSDLVRGLAARNHDVHVALRPGSALLQAFDELVTEERRIAVVPSNLRNALDVPSALRLARYVRRHEIEVIHAHLARDYPLAALAARLSHAPLIITRHLLFPVNPLHRLTLRAARKVICVSEGVARVMRGVVAEDKIAVVPNGIELSKFDNVRARHEAAEYRRSLKAGATLLVGSVGELRAHKGHADFLRAAALILQARRCDDVAFIIVGEDASTTQNHRHELERLARTLGIERRVYMPGWMDDLAPLYAALDVFVSASHTESFGLAILEAMASGAPAIIATGTAGATELLADQATGIIVPVADPHRLAAAIHRLLDDADFRLKLRRNARQAAHKRYNLNRMIEAVEAIYIEACEKPRARA